mmetsp:Transcript_56852/g.122964  ORF Transcript_56852/g.122964 Transcript_56852/m.122964 type:complete len:279 (-) Transcript_56852:264-1100(-)|eukprot:CAMPEP_0170576776 /NCGR_PEP_ID=MMETSP0224-20130122/4571_1 /TAXON_ID=285029 /ORGANISM="Togula jolla, Strain CCCM 725" /LENGTH=278 /DNA_ID=CAMNT_0010899637 /DNA_START=26 /DNA_END=865 /DNA_ORIENTATION=+
MDYWSQYEDCGSTLPEDYAPAVQYPAEPEVFGGEADCSLGYDSFDTRLAAARASKETWSRQVSCARNSSKDGCSSQSTMATLRGGPTSDMPVKIADDEDYWGASTWDPDNRIYVGAEVTAGGQRHDLNAISNPKTSKPPSTLFTPLPFEKQVSEEDYWGAAAWDPDERLYVGAATGKTNHLQAVADAEEEEVPPPNFEDQIEIVDFDAEVVDAVPMLSPPSQEQASAKVNRTLEAAAKRLESLRPRRDGDDDSDVDDNNNIDDGTESCDSYWGAFCTD